MSDYPENGLEIVNIAAVPQWTPGCGLLALDCWLWSLGCGLLAVDSWLWTPGCALLAGRHLGSNKLTSSQLKCKSLCIFKFYYVVEGRCHQVRSIATKVEWRQARPVRETFQGPFTNTVRTISV